MKKIYSVILLSLILWSINILNAQESEDVKMDCINAMHSITANDCLEYDRFFTSEECEGRGPCSQGFELAANYVADHFCKIGLKTLTGDESYFQRFIIDRNYILDSNQYSMMVMLKAPGGKDTLCINYDIGKDYLPAGVSSSCNITTNVVFAGYGITSEDNNWDDYKKVNVNDKVVLIVGGTPPLQDADFGSMHRINRKAEMARSHGAKALLLVGNPIGTISNNQSLPVVTISEQASDDLLKGTGRTIKDVKEKIREKQRTQSFELKNSIHLKINAELINDCETMNIVGYVEGSDPVLKDEYIVLGAHVDHLGKVDDLVFYGANDNGSGSSVVMEVAEAFASLEYKPRRSVLFILFTGEEMGLLGSSYFVRNPIVPLSKIKAMINLDMVGSGNDAVMVVGGNSYPEFAQLIDTLSQQYIHVPVKRGWTSPNSDHYPFHNAGIPSVFLYALKGVPTYHSCDDKAETLDPEVMERVGRLVFLTIKEVADYDKIDFNYVEKEK